MAGGLIMNLNFDFGIQGKVKYELTDTRTGEIDVIEENNMLLDDYLDSFFTTATGLLNSRVFHTCYIGDSDVAPARNQTGVQGSVLATKSPLEQVVDTVGELVSTGSQLFKRSIGPQYNRVGAMTFSPNGQQLATAGYYYGNNYSVWVLNSETGNLDFTFSSHTNYVRTVDWSPGGTLIASGGQDNTVKVWEYDTGTVIYEFTGHTGTVNSVSWSPDGTLIASCSGTTVKVWEYDTGTVIYEFTGHTGTVNSVDWSPGGALIASGSDDDTVKVWGYDTGTVIYEFTGHTSNIKTLKWFNDGTKIVSGSADNTIKVWEYDTGTITTNFTGHSNTILSVDVSPDDKYIVSCAVGEYYGKVWSVNAGNVIRSFYSFVNDNRDVYSVAYSSDGKIAGGSENYCSVNAIYGDLQNKVKMGYKYRFEAGAGTAMLIKEIALKTEEEMGSDAYLGNYYMGEWVARQVPTNPIDKKEYHQLDITWTIEVNSPTIYYTTTIADGQRDGTSIDVDVEIANRALGNLVQYKNKSVDTFFGIQNIVASGTGANGSPQIAIGTSNAKKYPTGDGVVENGILLEGTDISGGFIEPFEVIPEAYTPGSFSRTFRVGLESDQGNHADGIGEIILRDSAGHYFGRVLFTPPLDKVNTYRFYFDVTFSLNPS